MLSTNSHSDARLPRHVRDLSPSCSTNRSPVAVSFASHARICLLMLLCVCVFLVRIDIRGKNIGAGLLADVADGIFDAPTEAPGAPETAAAAQEAQTDAQTASNHGQATEAAVGATMDVAGQRPPLPRAGEVLG
jgi:hypothetical protein